MKHARRRLSSMFATALLLPAIGVSTAAAAESSSAKQEDTYCAMVVGKAGPGGTPSPVLAQECSALSLDDADTKLRSKVSQGTTRATNAELANILMYWYEHTDFNNNNTVPGRITSIYGGDGPCDAAGYRIEPTSWWKANLSSIIGQSNCSFARLTNIALTSTSEQAIWGGTGKYLGQYHDNVGISQPHA
ncbi:hypothetical protein [Amycolatopsis sp. 195334CR]|uniref:hypothetical protein n=1 Tax=Amycolatopsis sp. 195334CR TaxID=2814588 RepID=UPI001A8DEA3B|nr:hypothetical protein [Amycolatopsis sp. 195334CR]MBN6034136.1 hypothetical protein [Amycolatopsis sp. 195334CR]